MERYNEYKDSGIQWIGDIPSHWAAVPFKSMFSLQKGLTITKDDLTDEGIKVISYGQIHSKSNKFTYIVDDLYRYVPAHYLESNSNSLSEIGDFMFADTSEDVVGCGNFVRVDTEDKLFAGYHTIIGKIKDRECSKYLSYLFQADKWRCQIWIKVDGVKLFSISRKILNSTKIILPPLSEQTAIVAYLDTQTSRIDSFIANVEREIELLGEAKQRIIADAATKGLKKDVEMRDSGVEWLGEIPTH